MAILNKTFLAAVACGSIAFAASALAQTGSVAGGAAGAGAGGMAGASISATSGTGTTGTTGTSLGATSSVTGIPAGTTNGNLGLSTTNNTLANHSTTLGTNRMATNNRLGTNNTLAGGGTSLGSNGVGTNNVLAQKNLGVNAGPGVANNLGTHGPAGSTSVSSAQATATPGAEIPPNGAPALTTGGGSTNALGGKGVLQQRRIARAHNSHMHVANTEHVRHWLAANHQRRRELGSMARLNAHEHSITAGLNRAQLNHVTNRVG